MKINPDTLGRNIVAVASRFLNLREVRPNTQWDNPATPGSDAALSKELREMMIPSPWQDGWAYCAAYVEGVVAKAILLSGGTQKQHDAWRSLSTAHCMTNLARARSAGILKHSHIGAQAGSIWIAQKGSTTQGHEGIFISGTSTTISTIEANTSKDATTSDKDREGDWITTRSFNFAGRGTLRTRGFIHVQDLAAWLNKIEESK